MGKVLSVATRKARRFNAENRAHRFLDKEKLEPAPKYPSNLTDYQRVLEVNPKYAEAEGQKNVALDDRLKQVYVTSTDPVLAEAPNETKKPLPLNRKAVEDFEMGYMEPEKVRRGHTSLRHALTFISNYNAEPTTWTSEKIAEQYKLKPNVVESVLKHFSTFEVYIPDKKNEDKVLITDRLKKLWNDDKEKPLPPPQFEADSEVMLDRMSREHEASERKRMKDLEETKRLKEEKEREKQRQIK